MLLAALLLAPFVGLAPTAASAAGDVAAAAQVPPPSPSAIPLAVAPALISDPADGAFIDQNRVIISGQGTTAGNAVTVSAAGAAACTATVSDALTWNCVIPTLPNGASVAITATETLADGTTLDSTITVAVLGPPQLDEVSPTPGYVTGSGHPDATVTVTVAGAASCSTRVTGGGYWSCTPLGATGSRPPTGAQQVSAHQAHLAIGSGASSAPASRTITFDTQRPEPPVITQPAENSRVSKLPATFRGTGENGATIDVYLGGIPVCTTIVEGGAWGCSGGSGVNGSQTVRAVQRDQASNYSDPSAIIRFSVGPAAPVASAKPSPTPTPETSVSPSPSAPPASYPPASEGPWPVPAPGDPLAEALANWGTPTNFSAGIPGLNESVDRGNWWRAPLLALAVIALVALPLRLLASTLRGRIRWPFGQITGRNAARTSTSPVASGATASVSGWWTPWLAMSAPFAVTVAFMVVAGGVSGEVRYLRLAAAIAGALAVINIVGVAVATRIGSAWQRVDTQFRFRGLLFAAAIVSGLVSRLIGLSPPLITGTLIGMRPHPEAPVHKRAIIGLVQVATVLALGFAGWLSYLAVGPVVGFWPSLFSEFFAALCLAGLGSAVMLLAPVGGLPGRVVYEWHRWAWFGIAFTIATLAFAVLLGGASARFPLATLLMLAGGVAAVCIGAWAYFALVARPSTLHDGAVRQAR